MRVVTWNLMWRFGPWEERFPLIVSALAALDADVICFQETWRDRDGGPSQADVIASELGMRAAVGERQHMANAVLSRWPIISAQTFSLGHEPGRPDVRHAVLARVGSPHGEQLVASAHLDHRFDASALRQRQVSALADVVAAQRGDPASAPPVIVGADLNAVPDADEVRMLTGRRPPPVPGLVFTDAWEIAGDGTPGWTWRGDNPHLVTAGWPNRRLDYVLVSWPRPDGSPLTPVACRLAGTGDPQGLWPSDHLAVVADLRPFAAPAAASPAASMDDRAEGTPRPGRR